jgi:predicted esterase
MTFLRAFSLLGALILATATRAAGTPLCSTPSPPGQPTEAVQTIQTTLAGVPAILRIPKTITKPPIVLWHGLGPPASEADLMEDLPLDEVPALKVYLGLPLFGARAPISQSDSLVQRQAQDYALRIFEPVVAGAARELPAVLIELRKQGCLRRGEAIGLFGFSAGGTAVLMTLLEQKAPVRAAVTVNAPTGLRSAVGALERATKQPYAWSDASRGLAMQSDATQHAARVAAAPSAGQPPRALLLFHGADDKVILPEDTVALADSLRPFYEHAGSAPRLQLTIAPGVTHNWADRRTLDEIRAATADWFDRYL